MTAVTARRSPTTDHPVAYIQERVAREFGVTRDELYSSKRCRRVARPRQLAMYLASRLTHQSLPMIGRAFGKDHTTVMHAINVIERLMVDDPAWAVNVRRLHEELQKDIGDLRGIDRTIDELVETLRIRLKLAARRDPETLVERLSEIAGITFTATGGERS